MQMKIDDKVSFFKALSDENRLKILQYLLTREKCSCICELSKLLEKDQSVIFRHIQILKKAQIVETCKESKYLMCYVKDKNKIRKLLEE